LVGTPGTVAGLEAAKMVPVSSSILGLLVEPRVVDAQAGGPEL
jgi:hypothetical protein